MGFMILTFEFLPTQHNVVKYWEDVFSRLVRTPAWKNYLSDNQFKDGYLTGNNLLKFFDHLTVRLSARDRRSSLLGPSPVENRS
jgi:tripartite-type tricarboxylate transporter receptor subunit TctC